MTPKIEFFNDTDGSIYVKTEEGVKAFDENCTELIDAVIAKLRDLYPSAYDALSLMYAKSHPNKRYFAYKIVHRFIRCNFGEQDSLTYDIDSVGNFNFENVKCPLRGECKHEGIVCRPELQTNLSSREMEVVNLLLKGYDRMKVADELEISPYTVDRHLANIRHRLGVKSVAQIITKINNATNKN